ncbi:MAG: NAD(P)-dependent oxidoreductase [Gammaproteobacteria bacterium]|nr:NAD(P)-dependent oxidoreductase [Gammaproteobacteria bacterium]
MARVGFLGAGLMAAGMVRRLLAAGHEVSVYNRTAARARALVSAGARVAATPADAVADARFVVAMVGDDQSSRTVWCGPDGALQGAWSAGAIAMECSTLSPAWIRELGNQAGAAGLALLDCPVTGGPDGAAEGSLTVLAGGDATTLEAAGPVLEVIGRRVLHFGPLGAGASYKLVVNLMGSVQAAALAEGLALAQRAGLDADTVIAALTEGAVASPLVRYLAPRMRAGDHDNVYFATRWRAKDAAYGVELARSLDAPVPTGAIAAALFAALVEAGCGDRNESILAERFDTAVRGAGCASTGEGEPP